MVPPPPAMSKLRTQPTVSRRSSPSMWLREKRGCQSGRPLKSRTFAHTFSTGASITALTCTLVIVLSPSTRRPLPGRQLERRYTEDAAFAQLLLQGQRVTAGLLLERRDQPARMGHY